MSRDDSILFSGVTSASFISPREQQVKDKQSQAKQKRLEVTQTLKPAALPVLALIEKHKKNAMHVQAVAQDTNISDKEAGEMLRSQRKIYEFLLLFEREVKTVLKDVA